ncbi:MAG: transcriptional regulator [Candidatus Kariarchaeaceae archaeon]
MSDEGLYKDLSKIDTALHAPARIAVMVFLLPRNHAKFSTIQKALGVTAGNLSSHLKKLSRSSYIDIEKTFVDEKPLTVIHLTPEGQRAIVKYTEILNTALSSGLD